MAFQKRAFTSLLLTFVSLAATISGVVLYFSPRGRYANWNGWAPGGLTREEWISLHINTCLFLLVVASIHLVLNWRTFYGYIKRQLGQGQLLHFEMATALLATSVLLVATYANLPPFSTVTAWRYHIKNLWEQQPTNQQPLSPPDSTVGTNADMQAFR